MKTKINFLIMIFSISILILMAAIRLYAQTDPNQHSNDAMMKAEKMGVIEGSKKMVEGAQKMRQASQIIKERKDSAKAEQLMSDAEKIMNDGETLMMNQVQQMTKGTDR